MRTFWTVKSFSWSPPFTFEFENLKASALKKKKKKNVNNVGSKNIFGK